MAKLYYVCLQHTSLLFQKFVVPLQDNTSVISHEDYHPVFSNIQVRIFAVYSIVLFAVSEDMRGWEQSHLE